MSAPNPKGIPGLPSTSSPDNVNPSPSLNDSLNPPSFSRWRRSLRLSVHRSPQEEHRSYQLSLADLWAASQERLLHQEEQLCQTDLTSEVSVGWFKTSLTRMSASVKRLVGFFKSAFRMLRH